MESTSLTGLNRKLKAIATIAVESGSPSTESSQGNTDQTDYAPKRIILRRVGMWTGTLANDVELTNTRLYQDTNPGNLPDYYVRIGQWYVFNVTNGEVIDLRTDSKTSVVVWSQGRRRSRS